jgi:hypothetical protein
MRRKTMRSELRMNLQNMKTTSVAMLPAALLIFVSLISST